MTEPDEYNPLDYKNLTINLVRELMSRGPDTMPPSDRRTIDPASVRADAARVAREAAAEE